MSITCFTCSDMAGAVSPMSNTCYWGILQSLLLPDQNIEHVSFPNPNLHLCTKCMQMLHSISEFRNVAISSVSAQMEHWNREMDTLNTPSAVNVKTEIDILDIKQEIIDEHPVCDRINKSAGLHEEVMLETTEDGSSQVKIEEEMLNNTENNQEALVNWFLGGPEFLPNFNDEDGVDNGHFDGRISEPNNEEASEPEDVPRSTAPESSTRTYRTRKRTKGTADGPPTSKKKKNKYNTKLINKTQLEAHRDQLRRSQEFRAARYKCSTCLVVFGTCTSKTNHQCLYHSKRANLTECIVCSQTMHSVALAKHIASHFQRIECPECGHLADDTKSMKHHCCL